MASPASLPSRPDATDDSPAVRAASDTPAVRAASDTPAMHAASDTPAVHAASDTPAVHAASDTPAVRAASDTSSTGLAAVPAPGVLDRRRRMLDATVSLAADGGYEAVQMRVVARHAQVALGTVYRHFPSKVHLLVAALERELDRTRDRVDRTILAGRTAHDRLVVLVGALTSALQREPLLTAAMVRAYLFADASAADRVDRVAALVESMLAAAVGNTDEPNAQQRAVARVVSDSWIAALAAWTTGRLAADEVVGRMHEVLVLLVGDQREPIDDWA